MCTPPTVDFHGRLALFALVSFSALAIRGEPRLTWFRAEGGAAGQGARAVALVVHGLNLRPQKMEAIAALLISGGIDVLNVGLSGHNGDAEAWAQVSKEQWKADALQAYRVARSEADRATLPLYFVGFSLGGALALDLLSEAGAPEVAFDRMALFAPAAALRASSGLVLSLAFLGSRFIVPSLGNPANRANKGGTSMAAYEALFGLIRELRRGDLSRANIPTLLFIDPGDELVSEAGLRGLIRSKSLDRWRLIELSHAELRPTRGYKHQIIDEASLGKTEWGRVSRELLAFFSGQGSH